MNINNSLANIKRQDSNELRHQVFMKEKLAILEELFVTIERLRSQSFLVESNWNDQLDCRAVPRSDWAEIELLVDAYNKLMKEHYGLKN